MPARSQPATGAEAISAALVVGPAAAIVVGYTIDRFGFSLSPWVMLVVTLVAAIATLVPLWHRAQPARAALASWAALVGAVFSWLIWLAWPSLLPIGTGPDLTHHLQLIRYIDEHRHLVRDTAEQVFLGEMAFYTPGSHLLASLVGAWTGSSGLHALQPLLSLVAALKVGLVALIARRISPDGAAREPLAAAAALALFASQIFFLGPFLEYAFVAQVVAELFTVFAWWTLVVWDEDGGNQWLLLFGLACAALFLTWPMLIGPPMMLFGLLLLWRSAPIVSRLRQAAIGAALPTVYAAWFTFGRADFVRIAATGGKTAWPDVAAYGWPFLVASTLGVTLSLLRPRARTTGLLAVAILTQAAALAWVATREHNSPYMALKMFYPLVFVQAAGVAVFLGELWTLFRRWQPRAPATLAWVATAVVAALVVRSVAAAPRRLAITVQPAVTRPLELAGEWARANLPAGCVEYLVADDEASYWLHLAVLGNRRMSPRTGNFDTYDLTAALVRWLSPNGLPYAIAELPAVPSGVREEFDVIASFGTTAVVKRRGPSTCQ